MENKVIGVRFKRTGKLSFYITDNDDFVEINDQWYHKNCGLITFDEETDSYILK